MANELVSEKQLVVFALGEESFGVDIGTVREINQMQEITAVPGARYSVEGVINLRGSVIPVVDLRKRFAMEEIARGKDTRIMVMSSEGQDIGMIVDSVDEVLRISSESIEPPSSMVTGADSDYLVGIVKLADRLVILLDTDRVLSGTDSISIANLVSHAKESTGSPDDATEDSAPSSKKAKKKVTAEA